MRKFNGRKEKHRVVGLEKTCTWVNCTNKAKHQQPGSLIALCNEHNKKLNNDISNLFK